MKIVNFGSTYRIYGDDLKTYDQLPAGTYKVEFNPMAGFSLERAEDFASIEGKIYGGHQDKINKVLNSYKLFQRSLGLILSGNKGMGKSLFVQLLAEALVKEGLPVIMVTKAYPGIADYIDSIDQECLVMFDEFEKVFDSRNNNLEPQDNLLGLFDGTSQKKRMYAITVNELGRVNDFMISRPGRFHYHIRFDYPSSKEIEIYLADKLEPIFHGEIKHVVAFSHRVKLNYDSLRAIAFELNQGLTFKSAISDLNILMTDRQKFDLKVQFSNGHEAIIKGRHMNTFSEEIEIDTYLEKDDWVRLRFDSSKIASDSLYMTLKGEDVTLITGSDNEIYKDDEVKVESIIITHHKEIGVNYNLAY